MNSGRHDATGYANTLKLAVDSSCQLPGTNSELRRSELWFLELKACSV